MVIEVKLLLRAIAKGLPPVGATPGLPGLPVLAGGGGAGQEDEPDGSTGGGAAPPREGVPFYTY